MNIFLVGSYIFVAALVAASMTFFSYENGNNSALSDIVPASLLWPVWGLYKMISEFVIWLRKNKNN